jgi:hypothetical protein
MPESLMDKQSESGMPWASHASWQAVNQAVDYHLQRYRTDLKQLAILAREIKSCLNSVFPILDELCAHSCPWCPEPCCLSANVWFDFKDLLFLHFNNILISPAQPKANLRTPCRLLGPRGCRLPRSARPWICTWYLCPTQTAKLRNGHQAKRKLLNQAMAQIKSERNLLENEFIRIIY